MLIKDNEISAAVSNCLRTDVNFAIIRRAEEKGIHFFADLDHNCKDIHVGTVSAPHSSDIFFARQWAESGPAITITDSLSLSDIRALPTASSTYAAAAEASTQQADYLHDVSELVRDLDNEGPRAKTVISRIITATANVDVAAAARRLFASCPDATCCIFKAPDNAVWLVATPELLLSADEASGRLDTMALAGTKAADDNTPWDLKNREEHNIVTAYIADRLNIMAHNVSAAPTTDRVSGTVRHLCTPLTATLRHGITAADAAAYLSPTPAVCGTPPESARRHISTIERHARRFYSGYLGIATPGHNFSAYVTLRCARIVPGSFTVYAGGGITARSNAATEWQETQTKAALLLNILNKHTVTEHER